MTKLLLIAALALAPVFAQDATVIELSKGDAEKVQRAYSALQKAQAEWDKIRAEMRDKYTISDSGGTSGTLLNGKSTVFLWGDNFTFDSKFKFIVPKLAAPADNGWSTCFARRAIFDNTTSRVPISSATY